MKLEHSINAISRVSFSTRAQINPVTNEPTGAVSDNWEDISHAAAKGLEELQNRIVALEEAFEKVLGADKIEALLEFIAKTQDKRDRIPKEAPPEGLPLAQAKKKGGRPKKAI
jgi:hypothetical protein